MKKYETVKIEIHAGVDVVATSAEVTTAKILFPWSGPKTGDTGPSQSDADNLSDLYPVTN